MRSGYWVCGPYIRSWSLSRNDTKRSCRRYRQGRLVSGKPRCARRNEGEHGQGSYRPGQSERLKPDPRHRAQVSQVATNCPAGAHDRTGPKRQVGSAEQTSTRWAWGLPGFRARAVVLCPSLQVSPLSRDLRHREVQRCATNELETGVTFQMLWTIWPIVSAICDPTTATLNGSTKRRARSSTSFAACTGSFPGQTYTGRRSAEEF